jgi:hypothetical protein
MEKFKCNSDKIECTWLVMAKPLVVITVDKGSRGIEYKVECSNSVSSDELAHYLDEIIEGICNWKPGVCQETVKTIAGIIKEK